MSFKVLDNLGQTSPEIVEPVGPGSHPIASCLAFEATTFPACFTAENQS
jgi:hypothetical protein